MEAEREHNKTFAAEVEEQTGLYSDEMVDSIAENVVEKLDDEVEKMSEEIEMQEFIFTESELREIQSVLDGNIFKQNISMNNNWKNYKSTKNIGWKKQKEKVIN